MPSYKTRRWQMPVLGWALACAGALAPAGSFAGAMPGNADLPATDLLDAYHQARDTDPTLLQAGAQRRSVQETVVQARAPLLPQLGASIGWSQVTGGANADLTPAARARSRTPDLALRQTLLNLSQVGALRATEAQADGQNAIYRAARQDLLVRVAQAYVNVLIATESLAFVQSNEDAYGRQVTESRARYEAGLSALVDLDQARAYFASAQSTTLTARQTLADAREALAQVTGVPPGALKPLRADIAALPPEPADAQAWLAAALQTNPTLQALRDTVVANERSIDSARAGHLPTLTSSVDVGRPAAWPLGSTGQDGRSITTVGLVLSVPLFAGGATQSVVRQAMAQRDAAQDAYDIQRRSLARAVLANFRSVAYGVQQIAVTRDAVTAATTALAATRVGQQTGTHTMTDLLLAIQLVASAQSAYSQARHQFVLDKLLLLQSAGTVSESDLVAVNAQLQ